MPQRQLITVVIDSNAIWNDWHLDRKAWDVLQVFVEHGLLQVQGEAQSRFGWS